MVYIPALYFFITVHICTAGPCPYWLYQSSNNYYLVLEGFHFFFCFCPKGKYFFLFVFEIFFVCQQTTRGLNGQMTHLVYQDNVQKQTLSFFSFLFCCQIVILLLISFSLSLSIHVRCSTSSVLTYSHYIYLAWILFCLQNTITYLSVTLVRKSRRKHYEKRSPPLVKYRKYILFY